MRFRRYFVDDACLDHIGLREMTTHLVAGLQTFLVAVRLDFREEDTQSWSAFQLSALSRLRENGVAIAHGGVVFQVVRRPTLLKHFDDISCILSVQRSFELYGRMDVPLVTGTSESIDLLLNAEHIASLAEQPAVANCIRRVE